MRTLLLVGGTLLLLGGLLEGWTSVQAQRQGGPWRGTGLMAAALTAYGALTLTGVIFDGTIAGAVLVWIVAVASWAGVWLRRRERKQFVQ